MSKEVSLLSGRVESRHRVHRLPNRRTYALNRSNWSSKNQF